jgi:hypothetical protein
MLSSSKLVVVIKTLLEMRVCRAPAPAARFVRRDSTSSFAVAFGARTPTRLTSVRVPEPYAYTTESQGVDEPALPATTVAARRVLAEVAGDPMGLEITLWARSRSSLI